MTDLNEQLLLLVALQDLDTMIREAEDQVHADKLKAMGFTLEGSEALRKAREELAEMQAIADREAAQGGQSFDLPKGAPEVTTEEALRPEDVAQVDHLDHRGRLLAGGRGELR